MGDGWKARHQRVSFLKNPRSWRERYPIDHRNSFGFGCIFILFSIIKGNSMVLSFCFYILQKNFTNKYLSLLWPKNSLRVNVQKEPCYSKQENPTVSVCLRLCQSSILSLPWPSLPMLCQRVSLTLSYTSLVNPRKDKHTCFQISETLSLHVVAHTFNETDQAWTPEAWSLAPSPVRAQYVLSFYS